MQFIHREFIQEIREHLLNSDNENVIYKELIHYFMWFCLVQYCLQHRGHGDPGLRHQGTTDWSSRSFQTVLEWIPWCLVLWWSHFLHLRQNFRTILRLGHASEASAGHKHAFLCNRYSVNKKKSNDWSWNEIRTDVPPSQSRVTPSRDERDTNNPTCSRIKPLPEYNFGRVTGTPLTITALPERKCENVTHINRM